MWIDAILGNANRIKQPVTRALWRNIHGNLDQGQTPWHNIINVGIRETAGNVVHDIFLFNLLIYKWVV